MLDQIKVLSQQTLIYGAGKVFTRAVTFLLLPLYTNVFTPHDYGIISLAYAFMGLMHVALLYGLDAALMKRYIQAASGERSRYLATAYTSFLITSIVFAVLFLIFRRALAPAILGGDYPLYLAYVVGILLLDVLWGIPLLLLRSEERPLSYIGFSLLNVVSSLGLNFLLVLGFRMGIEGVLLSNLLTSGLIFLITIPIMWRRLRPWQISLEVWRGLMRFGLPFLPAGVFAMVMELADRYILKAMTDVGTVGIYSAGYKLGMLMMLIVMGFNAGWHPFFLKQKDTPTTRRLFARVASYLLAVLGFIWVLMCLWIPRLIRLEIGPINVYGPDFWQGAEIVPWIALGYLFHAAYLLQLPGVFQLEKSRWVAITRGVGALVNIVLNVALIPLYGALGAALATCFSFFLMALAFWMVNRRIYPLPYEWTRLLRVAVFIAAAYLLTQVVEVSVLRDVLLTFLYPLGLAASGFLTAGERSVLKRTVRNLRTRT